MTNRPMPSDPTAFLRSAPLVPFEVGGDGKEVLWVGAQAERLLGWSLTDWRDDDFWGRVILPDDQIPALEARRHALRSGAPVAIDYRVEHRAGRILWVHEAMAPNTTPEATSLCGYLVDITDRKRQEVALWKAEERLRTLVHGAPDAMLITDDAGVIQNMNAQAEALFDYQLAEIAGSSIDHLLPARLRHRVVEMRAAFDTDSRRRSLVDGRGFAIERSDGVQVPVELSLSSVPGPDDTPQIVWSIRDLTARRRMEAQLRSSERRLEQVANAVPGMVAFVDRTGRYRFVNEAYAEWHGWKPGQMEGRLVREVLGEGAYQQIAASVEAANQGSATHFRGEVENGAGERLPVSVSFVPQHDESSEPSGYFVALFDMSDEIASAEADRRHMAELAHVARVATLGELAASIAHEINQPLTAIVANAGAARHLLDQTPPALADARLAVEAIQSDGRRAGNVIASLRQLMERGEAKREQLDLPTLVDETIALLASEARRRGVRLFSGTWDRTLPTVHGDPIQLKQVLMNLIVNALEATSAIEGPREVEATASLVGATVEVAVLDNGVGLPAGDPENLFVPFVSKKPDGLGMGLAISRTITEAHDGSLWAERQADGGSRFILALPLG